MQRLISQEPTSDLILFSDRIVSFHHKTVTVYDRQWKIIRSVNLNNPIEKIEKGDEKTVIILLKTFRCHLYNFRDDVFEVVKSSVLDVKYAQNVYCFLFFNRTIKFYNFLTFSPEDVLRTFIELQPTWQHPNLVSCIKSNHYEFFIVSITGVTYSYVPYTHFVEILETPVPGFFNIVGSRLIRHDLNEYYEVYNTNSMKFDGMINYDNKKVHFNRIIDPYTMLVQYEDSSIIIWDLIEYRILFEKKYEQKLANSILVVGRNIYAGYDNGVYFVDSY